MVHEDRARECSMSAASGISMYAMLGAWRGENDNAHCKWFLVVVILVPMKEKNTLCQTLEVNCGTSDLHHTFDRNATPIKRLNKLKEQLKKS